MRPLACLAAAAFAIVVSAPRASALCIAQTEGDAVHRAEVILEGEVMAGPTVEHRTRQVSDGFARFRVLRYRKGHGPDEVRVPTAVRSQPGGMVSSFSDGITPAPGERWIIYGDRQEDGTIFTSICSGSHLAGERPLFDDGPAADARDLVRYQWPVLLGGFAAAVAGAVLLRRRSKLKA
ncbi:MAG: hypothetical protein ACRDHY_10555 [Anaerolineales bacterium]